jgi:aminoacylase
MTVEYLCSAGLKAFGFSPMRRSPILLHEHDEYIDRAVFIEGCNVYLTIIRALSSQESGEIDKL